MDIWMYFKVWGRVVPVVRAATSKDAFLRIYSVAAEHPHRIRTF